jgi:hypothetical protein
MHVTRLECGNCDSALEGQFTLGAFQNLSAEQLQFLEVFIRSRGQNKAIQELLNISYPTVIKKLDELIVALGYEPAPAPVSTPPTSQREVLEMLKQGEINALQAQQLLAAVNGSKNETEMRVEVGE